MVRFNSPDFGCFLDWKPFEWTPFDPVCSPCVWLKHVRMLKVFCEFWKSQNSVYHFYHASAYANSDWVTHWVKCCPVSRSDSLWNACNCSKTWRELKKFKCQAPNFGRLSSLFAVCLIRQVFETFETLKLNRSTPGDQKWRSDAAWYFCCSNPSSGVKLQLVNCNLSSPFEVDWANAESAFNYFQRFIRVMSNSLKLFTN